MNDEEVWKTYPEFDFIQGSSLGRVRTVDRVVVRKDRQKQFVKGRVLKQRRNKNGYMYVYFGINGKTVGIRVHRIIATCFLENPDNLYEVNHLDCNPMNNHFENLKWCSRKENIAYRDKLGHLNVKDNAPKSPVIAINLNTLESLYFPSQNEAARELGAGQGNIYRVLKGRFKQINGYWFVRADSSAVENTKQKFGNEVARKVEALLKENQK